MRPKQSNVACFSSEIKEIQYFPSAERKGLPVQNSVSSKNTLQEWKQNMFLGKGTYDQALKKKQHKDKTEY